MVTIKTDLVNGRELKVGSIYIPQGEKAVFCKITGLTTSKPGKHGSAKSIVVAKNIVNGKTVNATFKDTDEKIIQILDFSYNYKVVYSLTGTEMCVSLESGEMMYFQNFAQDQSRVAAAFEENRLASMGFTDEQGNPLCIKYSELGDANNTLLFWELLYLPKNELPRYGITDYTE